jgi:hypothetical protein
MIDNEGRQRKRPHLARKRERENPLASESATTHAAPIKAIFTAFSFHTQ